MEIVKCKYCKNLEMPYDDIPECKYEKECDLNYYFIGKDVSQRPYYEPIMKTIKYLILYILDRGQK